MASLVAHAGALGDFITTLPAIDAWRLLHPGEPLILLGKPLHAALAGPPGFDEVWDIERARFAPLFGGVTDLGKRTQDLLRDISSALLFSTAASPLLPTLAAAGIKEIIRQDPFPRFSIPIVDYHLSLFSPEIVASVGRVPRIFFAAESTLVRPVIALHPGSGSIRKNWPRTRFLALADELQRRGEEIAWVLGPSEHEFAVPESTMVWRENDLTRLAGRLAGCRCYVGNDSGVTHLAAAVGCPTIALFGASDKNVWAPRGRLVTMLSSATRDVKNLTVKDVLRIFQELTMSGSI